VVAASYQFETDVAFVFLVAAQLRKKDDDSYFKVFTSEHVPPPKNKVMTLAAGSSLRRKLQ
jgi:hypothetical protein